MSTTLSTGPVSARLNSNAVLAGICLVLAIALPVMVVGYLATASAHALAVNLGLPASSPLSAAGYELSVLQRVIVIATGVVPVGCMAIALIYARSCFLCFSRGELFALAVVRGLRGCAGALFFSGVAGLLVPPLASVLLSAAAGGRLSLTLQVESNQLLLLLFAGVVWQIAAVMAKAVVLAEEHSQFI